MNSRKILALWLALLPLVAQQPPRQTAPQTEVTLTTRPDGRVGLALPPPQISGLGEAEVEKDFTEVVKRDLDESGTFVLVKGPLPKATDPSTYKAWTETVTDWLLTVKITQSGSDELVVNVVVIDPKVGKNIWQKNYTGKAGVLRRIAHTLSDDLVARLTGDKGVASTRVVFIKAMPNNVKEVWQVDRDGANAFQVTHHQSLTLSPTVAADGRLAYITYKGGPPEIWGQKKPGGPHVRLFPTQSGVSAHCSSPTWSPDGKRLAFVQQDRRGNSDIVVLDVETGRTRRLTDSHFINTEPTWNPAGTVIAFTSDRDGGPQVFLMEEDGSNVRRLTTEGNYNASPSWSPNGAMIAYVSRFEGKFDLFVYKLGEGKAYQITTGVASSEGPAWSPDERRLVFTSTRTGNQQLFTTDLSGNSVRKLSELVGCQSPRWTRSR